MQDEFETLCQEQYSRIYKYIRLQLGDKWAADDVTQEVFLVAYQKRKHLLKHEKPIAFLYKTASNLCKAYLREKKKHPAGEVKEDSVVTEDAFDTYQRLNDRSIDESQLSEQVLSILTPDKRALYDAYYVQHIPMNKIAEQMGVKPETLRMRYVRLRKELAQEVKKITDEKMCYLDRKSNIYKRKHDASVFGGTQEGAKP